MIRFLGSERDLAREQPDENNGLKRGVTESLEESVTYFL